MRSARRLAAWMAAVLAGAALLCPPARAAATLPAGFDEQTLASGLTRPTAVAWAPDGRMFIAEKDGLVRVMDANGVLEPNPVIDIRPDVNTDNDRGLLGIAVDSDYANPAHRYLYLLYSYESDPGTYTGPKVSQLRRVVVNPDNSVGSEQVVLGTDTTTPCPSPSNTLDCIPSDGDSHSIGTVRSDPDGSLWVGSGDAAGYGSVDPLAFRSYDESSMAGKIMHVDRNGNGLPGHPFCPSDTDTTHVCTKLYAKGFRNPFRFTLRSGGLGPAVGDVGWDSWEELDMIQAGGDYGWPCWEATHQTPGYSADPQCSGPDGEYTKTVLPPVYEFSHAGGAVAVVGGPTYAGGDFPAGYEGTTFIGDYGSGVLRRFDPVGGGSVTTFATNAQPWVDLETAPAGLSYAHGGDLVYVSIGDFTDGTGSVGRILYTAGSRTPVPVASGNPTTGDAPLTVAFSGHMSSDPDGDSLTFDWDFGDGSTHSSQPDPSHGYANRGAYIARLTVTDGEGLSAVASVPVTVGGPKVTIVTPTNGSLYRDGAAVTLQGSARDFSGQAVPDSGLQWQVILHHSTSHIHDLGMFRGGSTGFTPLVDHDADSWYDIILTATDSDGLNGSQTVTIHPQTIAFVLTSTPAGATVSYGGINQVTPFATTSAIGFQTSVSAVQQFTGADGSTYVFDSWSDGGARLHDVTIPAGDTTLTARYRGLDGATPAQPALEPSGAIVPLVARGVAHLRVAAPAAGLRRGRLSGKVTDAFGVRRVDVAVRARRRGGTPCRWWSSRRRALGRPHACSEPAWIRARVAGSAWSASLGRSLPRGAYVVLVRATDRRGRATTRIISVRLR